MIKLTIRFMAFSVIVSLPVSAQTSKDMFSEVDTRFSQAIKSESYEQSLELIDEVILDSRKFGIQNGPAFYFKALRNVTHGDASEAKLVLQALDADVLNAVYLLPNLPDYTDLTGDQRLGYLNKAFGFLNQRTTAGSWTVPMMMSNLVKQRSGSSKLDFLIHWYSSTALRGASPTVNSLLLISKDAKNAELAVFCGRIEWSGSINKLTKCADLRSKGVVFDKPSIQAIQDYQAEMSLAFGSTYEEVKRKVCGQLNTEYLNTPVCFDALAAISEFCILRSKTQSYGNLEGKFLCNEKDIRWVLSQLAAPLETILNWKILK